MPLYFVRDNIINLGNKVDAIVNTANPLPQVGRGTDLAIFEAAGKEKLLNARKKIGNIEPGDAKATDGYNLCKYIIHVVGPCWIDGKNGELDVLRSCYRNAFECAKKNMCRSIAFPLISSGVYGISKVDALDIALSEIINFLLNGKYKMDIILCLFDDQSVMYLEKIFPNIEEYLNSDEAKAHLQNEYGEYYDVVIKRSNQSLLREKVVEEKNNHTIYSFSNDNRTFKEMVNFYLNQINMKSSQLYSNINIGISKQQYSKYINLTHKPTKEFVIKIATLLKLNLSQSIDLLSRTNLVLNPSDKKDIKIYNELSKKNVNIKQISKLLDS